MKFLINYKPVILTLFSNLQIQGQIHHRIGSLLPLEDARHKFLQIYFMLLEDKSKEIYSPKLLMSVINKQLIFDTQLQI